MPSLQLSVEAIERTPSLDDDESVWSPSRAWRSSPRCQGTPPLTPPLAQLSEPFLHDLKSDVEVHRDGDGQVEVDKSEVEESTRESESDTGPLRFHFHWRRFWQFLGPGFLISLAYLDPGNLEANLQSGAYTGLRLTWVLWWATVLGLVMQETAARLALVTGRDLAQVKLSPSPCVAHAFIPLLLVSHILLERANLVASTVCRKHMHPSRQLLRAWQTVRAQYPRWLTHAIYVMMEAAVIAADIQEVVGSSVALLLLSNGWIPLWLGCIITGLDTLTFLAVQHLGIRYLELLIALLIGARFR